MTRQENVIYLDNYCADTPTAHKWAAYERRAVRRYRRAAVCQILTVAADLIASAGIGLSLLLAVAVFAQIV